MIKSDFQVEIICATYNIIINTMINI